MITTFRIDERLIHGQIIATWLKSLGITHLIVANDELSKDESRQRMLKLAVPNDVKCLIKSIDDVIRVLGDERCQKMKIMLICCNPNDALKLLKSIPGINEVNLANFGTITKPEIKDKLSVSPMVYLDKDDVLIVNEIIDLGKPVFTQKTPVEVKKVLKKL